MVKGQKTMAGMLGISISTLKVWMRKGIFPKGEKIGGVTSPMVWKSEMVSKYMREPQ